MIFELFIVFYTFIAGYVFALSCCTNTEWWHHILSFIAACLWPIAVPLGLMGII